MISRDAWRALGAEARQVWLDGLLERLPAWLVLVDPGELALFEDARHGLRFVLVPEAPVTIGVTPERYDAAMAALDRAPMQLFSPEVSLPARTICVPAHLAALAPGVFDGQGWQPRVGVAGMRAQLASRGWRLPSEVEWELHYRSLPTTPSMCEGELCLDDWHVGYDASWLDASPRGSSAEVVRVASTDPDDVRSIVPARLPLRSAGGAHLRPVIDLPVAP